MHHTQSRRAKNFSNIFTARCYASAVFAVMSVRPSVTFVDHVKTTKDTYRCVCGCVCVCVQSESGDNSDDEDYDPQQELKRRRLTASEAGKAGGAHNRVASGTGRPTRKASSTAKGRSKVAGGVGMVATKKKAVSTLAITSASASPPVVAPVSVAMKKKAVSTGPVGASVMAPDAPLPISVPTLAMTSASASLPVVAPVVTPTDSVDVTSVAVTVVAPVSTLATSVTTPVSSVSATPSVAPASTCMRVTTADIMSKLVQLEQKMDMAMQQLTRLTADNVAVRHDLVVCALCPQN